MTALKNSLTPSRMALLILVCFFLSGLTGLMYEVLWTRMIVKIIGGAPYAVSIILTIFMGGLGLGAWIAGRTIDRIDDPKRLVRIYGLLEIVIGAYGLLLPLLLTLFRPLFALMYNGVFEYFMLYNLLTFVGCAILLIIPVTCMGATLPVLSRFYVSSLGHLGTHTGRLYGLNTIGAGFGALAAGFWLLAAFGVWGTLAIAVALNFAIGLLCILVARPAQPSAPRPSPKTITPEPPPTERAYPNKIVYGSLIVFAVSGFCSMSYEVVWAKLLGLMVGPTTYSFTIVLVSFIVGLALGAMFFGWLADRTGRPASLLLITQIIAAIAALGVSQMLGNSQLFFSKLIFAWQDSFTALSIVKALSLFLIMLPPTFCLGATFPLVSKIFTPSTARVGHSIGLAYAINTIGAVLGSFTAGFILVPLFGKAGGLSLVIGLQLANALLFGALVFMTRSQRLPTWIPAMGLALAALILTFLYPAWDRQLHAVGKYHRLQLVGLDLERTGWIESLVDGPELLRPLSNFDVVYFGDGASGTTCILETTDPLGNVHYSMTNGGKPDASSRGDMPTQTLAAHIGLLFHPNPKSVMILGLASGVTAGEALHYPIERLDAVEISPEVVEASDFFRPWNNNVLDDPRTNIILQDGRAHLAMTSRRYDIISSEPSNPWMAGLATLFTREFFTHAHDALNENGIFIQFLHSYQMNWETFSMVGRTFADIFPNSMLVSTSPAEFESDYLLVGIKGNAPLDFAHAQQALVHMNKSRNVTLSDSRVLARLINAANLPALFGAGLRNSDNRPHLEFAAPKLIYQNDPEIGLNISRRGQLSAEVAALRTQLAESPAMQLSFAEYLLSVNTPFHGPFPPLFDFARADSATTARYLDLVASFCGRLSPPPQMLEDQRTRETCIDAQISAMLELLQNGQGNDETYPYVATLLGNRNRDDEAIKVYAAWLTADPRNAQAHYNLGQILFDRGNFSDALIHMLAADRAAPDQPRTLIGLGNLYGRMARLDLAADYFTRALRIDRTNPRAHLGLATTRAASGDFPAAIESYRTALRFDPNLEEAIEALRALKATP